MVQKILERKAGENKPKKLDIQVSEVEPEHLILMKHVYITFYKLVYAKLKEVGLSDARQLILNVEWDNVT